MRQNKKIISLVAVLAMIISMFSSMIVVNAANGEVYTELSEDGKTLTIGYKGFADGLQVGNTQIKVKVPEGVTASDLAVTDTFAKGQKSISGDEITVIYYNGDEDYTVGSEGVIATAKIDAPAGATGKFEITDFAFTLSDFSTVKLADVTVTTAELGNSGSEDTEEPKPEGQYVYAEASEIVDGKGTLTIGYANFADGLQVGNTQIKVKLPAGVSAENLVVTDTFVKGQKSISDGEITVIYYNGDEDYTVGKEGVIATADLVVADTSVLPAKAQITDFAFTLSDFSTIKLSDVATYTPDIKVGNTAEEAAVTGIEITPETKEAKAGETVEFTVTVSGTGDFDKTFKADKGTADVANGKVTYTVADDAAKGDTVTITVSAGDFTDTATITVVEDEEEETAATVPAEETTIDSKGTKAFSPKVAAEQKDTLLTALKADAGYATATYRVVFDFQSAKGNNVGWALVNLTGAELEDVINGTNDARKITATAVGAATSKIHFEDSNGNIVK